MPPAFVSGMVPLGDVIVPAGGQATIDFQNIDQSFTHLRLEGSLRGDTNALDVIYAIRFNNDSGANYSAQFMGATGGTQTPGNAVGGTSAVVGQCPAATSTASTAGILSLVIPNYVGTAFHKGALTQMHEWPTLAGGSMPWQARGISWASTAAINRITIFPNAGNFVAGSRATLYGISATPQPVGGASIIPRLTSTQMSALVPFDGQVIDLIADATNGINWRLRYNANSASAYKWEFVGGPPMLSDVQTLEAFAGTNAYGACPTDGPAIIVPRAGDYVAQFNAESYNTISPGTNWISPKHGAAGTSDNDSSVVYLPSGSTSLATHYRSLWLTALPASTDIHMYYKVSTTANTGNFRKRELRVTPIRVS
jgi:hypothetical protein